MFTSLVELINCGIFIILYSISVVNLVVAESDPSIDIPCSNSIAAKLALIYWKALVPSNLLIACVMSLTRLFGVDF